MSQPALSPAALGTLKGLSEFALFLRQRCAVQSCSEDYSTFLQYLLDETDVLAFHLEQGFSEERIRDEGIQIHTLLRWLEHGMPAFDITHGLMAALLLTDPADVGAEAVKLPFGTFAVRLPAGFWTLANPQGQNVNVTVALVHSYAAIASEADLKTKTWSKLLSFRLICQDGVTTAWEIREPLPESGLIGTWIGDDVAPVQDDDRAILAPDERDHRLLVAFRRLLINLCLYVTAHGPGEKLGKRKVGGGAPGQLAVVPDGPEIWVVGREVKMDSEVLASAKAYTEADGGGEREGWRLRARFTVRGHWRNQPYGEGRQLRKMKWIAPFWKGEGVNFAHIYKPRE